MLKTFAILASVTAMSGVAVAQTTPAPAAPAAPQTMPAPAAPAGTVTPAATGTIVQILAETPDRSTLAKLVTTAGLTTDLSGPGPFTV